MKLTRWLVPPVFFVLAVPALGAQADPRIPDGRAIGVTVDRLMLESNPQARIMTFTFHYTELKRNALGPDISIGTAPTILAAMHLPIGVDVGGGYNIALPRVSIIPRAGASAVMLIGPYVSGYALGYHFGASVLINVGGRDAIRLDITRRSYFRDHFNRGYIAIGIGVSGIPKRL